MASYTMIFALIFTIKLVLAVREAPLGVVGPNPHNLYLGSRVHGDRLLLQKFIYIPARPFLSFKQVKTIQTPFHEKITRVELEDLKIDGFGARVKLVNNGPGFRDVTVKFYSQWNHGVHFSVRLYGH